MDGKIVAEVSLPNFKKDEVKVTTDKGVLEISAEHKEKEEDENKKRYYLRESSSHYLRRVSLPKGTQTDKVGAEFKDGILKVTMPVDMPTKSKAKEVHIK
jgi:HSP20 family protein